jgi:hypothetical protein
MGNFSLRRARLLERHEAIVADQLGKIEAALAAAAEAEVRDPMAVVVDQLDGVGILVAEGLGMNPWNSTLPGCHVVGRVRDLRVVTSPRRRVVAALRRIRPDMADFAEVDAVWGYRVVVVADGDISVQLVDDDYPPRGAAA